jgi:pyruvate ferredoxin oxidoreductase beta subunit
MTTLRTLDEAVAGVSRCVLDAAARGAVDAPADEVLARSIVPAGTGARRDFSHLAPEMPEIVPDACVGCMACVTACPDDAIDAKVALPEIVEAALAGVADEAERARLRGHFAHTQKYADAPAKRGEAPGLFGLAFDARKCKGCGECVEVCGEHRALRMVAKDETVLARAGAAHELLAGLPPTPEHFVREKVLVDCMLATERSRLYVGGAGSCAGCGEATAIRMMLAATGFAHGRENVGIVAASGCNTVFGSTFPWNPYLVPWTNSLFENAPAVALGVRLRWDQQGWAEKRLWVVGGDGALYDIGFASLSRLLASGADVKVLVLDTQVYSNTGGQASTATFTGQSARMMPVGRARPGKTESRKEIARIALMHPDTFVAQTTPAHENHFYRAILEANSFPGPALVAVYATCLPEHGVPDDSAHLRAKLAVESRAFPLLVHDPRRGATLAERISLAGNPNPNGDWALDPATRKPFTFVDFARGEARFAAQFAADGTPNEALRRAEADRLANWRLLQELAGVRARAA